MWKSATTRGVNVWADRVGQLQGDKRIHPASDHVLFCSTNPASSVGFAVRPAAEESGWHGTPVASNIVLFWAKVSQLARVACLRISQLGQTNYYVWYTSIGLWSICVNMCYA